MDVPLFNHSATNGHLAGFQFFIIHSIVQHLYSSSLNIPSVSNIFIHPTFHFSHKGDTIYFTKESEAMKKCGLLQLPISLIYTPIRNFIYPFISGKDLFYRRECQLCSHYLLFSEVFPSYPLLLFPNSPFSIAFSPKPM